MPWELFSARCWKTESEFVNLDPSYLGFGASSTTVLRTSPFLTTENALGGPAAGWGAWLWGKVLVEF